MDEFRKEIQEVLMQSGYLGLVSNEQERKEMIDNACTRLNEVRKRNERELK